MATIDQYKIKIDVDGESKVKSLTKSLDGLGSTIAGIGFTVFIANAFRMADAMNDIADATGLTAGYVKGLGNALQQAGGNMDDVGQIVNKFYQNVDDLANGSDKAADAFGKLGIKGKDLLSLSRQDVLGLTLKRLSEMGPSAERTALGIEIFGKAFGKIDPKKLEEILKTQDFAKLDAEVRKAAGAYDAMEANILTLQQAVLATFAPLIGDMDNMRLSAEQAETIIKALAITFGLAFGAKTLVNIIEITKAIRQMAVVSSLLGKNPVLKLLAGGALAVGVGAAIDKLMEAQGMTIPEVGGTSSPAEAAAAASKVEATQKEKAAKAAILQTAQMRQQLELARKYRQILIDNIGNETTYLDALKQDNQVIQDFQNDILSIQTKIEEEKAKGKDANQGIINQLIEQLKIKQEQAGITLIQNQQERDRLQTIKEQKDAIEDFYDVYATVDQIKKNSFDADIANQLTLGKITQDQAAQKTKIFNLQLQRDAKINELQKQIELDQATNGGKQVQRLQEQQARVRQLYDAMIVGAEQGKIANDALMQSLAGGAINALQDIAKQLTPYQAAQDSVLAIWKNINNAIDTGKFKFSDFAKSVIADIGRIIAKMLIWQAIGITLKALFPGSSVIADIFKAEGGPVSGGNPYIVGEKGPELFVPPSSGKIIPNNQLGGKSSGPVNAPVTNNYNNYTINALDAKSVAQLFAENRKAIFGANKMAEREMSYAGVR